MKPKLINTALNQLQLWILYRFASFVSKDYECSC